MGNKEKILEFIRNNENCTLQEVADGCKVSIATVLYHLNKLEWEGKISRFPRKHRSLRAL